MAVAEGRGGAAAPHLRSNCFSASPQGFLLRAPCLPEAGPPRPHRLALGRREGNHWACSARAFAVSETRPCLSNSGPRLGFTHSLWWRPERLRGKIFVASGRRRMARVMTEIAHLMNDGDLELGTRA